jgi:hypothetical protein
MYIDLYKFIVHHINSIIANVSLLPTIVQLFAFFEPFAVINCSSTKCHKQEKDNNNNNVHPVFQPGIKIIGNEIHLE